MGMDSLRDPEVVAAKVFSPNEEDGLLSPLLQITEDDIQNPNAMVVEGFPGSIKYIVWNEFCERFSFYGMKTILALYLLEHFLLTENQSTEIVHLFIVMSYATPLIGAFLSDSLWGKYRTILYLSLVYCAGNWAMAASATSKPSASSASSFSFWVASAGLILISFGTGGIKPCVAAFGGDQIEYSMANGHSKERLQRQFFSLYYFAINSGSFISTLLTPILRAAVSYTVAFAVPAILMMCALFIFFLGRKTYIDQPPTGNILVQFFTIVFDALKLKLGQNAVMPEVTSTMQPERSKGPSNHWLDAAIGKHEKATVEDVKAVLRVLLFLLPTPLFWSLSDQQSSKWVFQAQQLDGRISWLGGLVIQPDQMQVFNPIFILLLIPLFNQVIYPLLEKCGLPLRPIWRITLGMLLSSLAFVVSALLQFVIDHQSNTPSTFLSTTLFNSESGSIGVVRHVTSISILWQVPQLFLITVGEILFSITGLEFAYAQAPRSMKSLVQSVWLFTVAAGNLVTVIMVAILGSRLSKTNEFLSFAGICLIAMLMMLYLGSDFDQKNGQSSQSEEGAASTDSTETQVFME